MIPISWEKANVQRKHTCIMKQTIHYVKTDSITIYISDMYEPIFDLNIETLFSEIICQTTFWSTFVS